MVHDRGMTTTDRSGPEPEAIVTYITETWPETDVVQAMNAWFFSLDPEKHWPNYATLVTTDEHDEASNLSDRASSGSTWASTGRRSSGWPKRPRSPTTRRSTRVLPHPVYAAQRWICIVNPSERPS